MGRSQKVRGAPGYESDGEDHRKVILLSEYRQGKHLGDSDDDPPHSPSQAARVGFAKRRICRAVAGRNLKLIAWPRAAASAA